MHDGEVIGAVQYEEEDDPEFRHAGIDIFLTAIRSYGKAGFKPVGIMRSYARDHATGAWQDALLTDLLAEELI